MRTLEEVKKHLEKTVYGRNEQENILGFLVGKGILNFDDFELDFAGNEEKDFKDFIEWFNKEDLKVKAYQNGEWKEVNFDEMIESLNDFKPVIYEKVLSDSMFEKIMKELGIGDNDNSKKSNKYKERELSILDSMGLDKINPLALSTEALKAVNELLQRRNELEKELNETVD
jgi:hypothetical protein